MNCRNQGQLQPDSETSVAKSDESANKDSGDTQSRYSYPEKNGGQMSSSQGQQLRPADRSSSQGQQVYPLLSLKKSVALQFAPELKPETEEMKLSHSFSAPSADASIPFSLYTEDRAQLGVCAIQQMN